MMTDDLLSFEVYAPHRGNPLSMDGDGTVTLRLMVPPCDREAAIQLCDVLRAREDGEPVPVRLVVVRDA